MVSIISTVIGSSKHALVLISLIVVVTIVDSQFINIFYGRLIYIIVVLEKEYFRAYGINNLIATTKREIMKICD